MVHSPFVSNIGLTMVDDHVFSVDVEFGVILRFAARIDGSEFDVTEVAEIVFGESFLKCFFGWIYPA